MNATIQGFVRKEFAQAMRDRRMRVAIFVIPLIQLAVFGLALSTEVRRISLAARVRPDDPAGKRLVERAFASGWFIPARARGEDPFLWVRSGSAEAALVMPPEGLTAALAKGHAPVQALIDGSNSTRARGIDTYLRAILAETVAVGRPRAPPLTFSVRLLYNPEMQTRLFLVPGVMCLILGIAALILTSMAMARERELGTFETLISAPVQPWEIIVGKTLPYFLIGMAQVPLVLAVARFGFGVPVRGPMWQIAAASAAFVATQVALGFLVSSVARSQQQAMMGGFILLFPGIQLSGIIFPVENMPPAIAWAGYLNPFFYFVHLNRQIMLRGGDLGVFLKNILPLTALGVAAGAVALRRFRRTLD